MGVNLVTTGNYDILGGSQNSNIVNYSVSVEAPTQNPGSFRGGTTRATVNGLSDTQTFLAFGEEATLSDDLNGRTIAFKGDISGVTETDFSGLGLTLDSVLARVNVEGEVAWMPGVSLKTAVEAFIGAAGVSPVPTITSEYATVVTLPGFKGNLLDGLKQMLSAYACYLEDGEDGNLVVRVFNPALGTGTADAPVNFVGASRAVTNQTPVFRVDMNYYQWSTASNQQVYPYTLPPTSITVDATEVAYFEFKLNASVSSVVQPVPRLFIDINSPSFQSLSAYVVTDNTGAPVNPDLWLARGGHLSVELIAHDTIRVRVVGMEALDETGPYRISHVYDNVEQPALFITGTGVRSDMQTVALYTGSAKASPTSVTSVDNPYISTLTQAYDRGQWAASEAAMSQTLGFTASANLRVGLRVRVGNVVYRINSKTLSRGKPAYSAIIDTELRDFNAKFVSGTIAAFNARWPGRKMRQVNVEPLREN